MKETMRRQGTQAGGAPASSKQGPAQRGAGTRLRDATAEPAVSASVIPAPCASPGSDPKGSPLPPCDAPRLRDAHVYESGAALSSAGAASIFRVTSPKGAPVPPSDGAQAAFVSRILMLVLAIMLVPALTAGPASGAVPKESPRLASLQIEIWPEFDRPAALVILNGVLAADVALPAAVSLRIPAASGGPTAVASSTGPGANLANLKYDRKDADDFITLRFEVPGRVFHVEFYEPLVTRTPERSYTYVWPGDLAADRLSVVIQEPATASNLSVQPNLDAAVAGQNGLFYRSAELGALEAGKQLPIRVSYTKSNPRTSEEILKPNVSSSSPVPNTGSGKAPFGWVLVLGVTPVLLIGAGAAFLWWRRRRKTSGAQPGGGFCSQCGAQSASGDRFCSKCGAPLK